MNALLLFLSSIPCCFCILSQGLGDDADYRGVVVLHNAPFDGPEAFFKMSEEACSFPPIDVAVPRNPGKTCDWTKNVGCVYPALLLRCPHTPLILVTGRWAFLG